MSSNSNQKKPFGQEGVVTERVFMVEKKRGETLAVLVGRFRQEYAVGVTPQGLPLPVTYAGRLDPMAEGQVILLAGEACKERDVYMGYDKVYDFTVLLGVGTDTGDVLGLIAADNAVFAKYALEEIIAKQGDVSQGCAFDIHAVIEKKVIPAVLARKVWTYPAFSSKTIDGVPLFAHAKAGTLPQDIPTQKGTIISLVYKGERRIARDTMLQEIVRDIGVVEGDFRQEEIIANWQKWNDAHNQNNGGQNDLVLLDFTATVTSGMYIRSIAEYVGELLGVPALAYRINRTKINTPTK